jgi:hypothetical protein
MSGEFSDLLLPFGLSADGRMVMVSEVERGADCGCACPQCRAPLVAKKGDVLRHHFAHAGDGCGSGALETSLHKMAKQMIADAGRIWLPEIVAQYPEISAGHDFIVRTSRRAEWIGGTVRIEVAIEDLRADAIIDTPSMPIALEIFVTHAVDAEKRNRFCAMNLTALEIDLSSYPRSFEPEELRWFVLRQAPRFWVYHQKLPAVIERLKVQYFEELERRSKAERSRQDAVRQSEAESWGQAWDADNSPEARLKRQKAEDFERAERMEERRIRADVAALPEPKYQTSYLAGLRRAALLRPTRWTGLTAYPTKGAYCGKCSGSDWYQTNTGWGCSHCAPGLALEVVA